MESLTRSDSLARSESDMTRDSPRPRTKSRDTEEDEDEEDEDHSIDEKRSACKLFQSDSTIGCKRKGEP